MHSLKVATGDMWDTRLLLRTAFKGIGPLSRAELDFIRLKQQVRWGWRDTEPDTAGPKGSRLAALYAAVLCHAPCCFPPQCPC